MLDFLPGGGETVRYPVMNSFHIRIIVLFSAALLCALVFVPALVAGSGGPEWPVFWTRLAFSRVCHQLPERSIWFLGWCLPVCARCAGAYLGVFGGCLLAAGLTRSGLARRMKTSVLMLLIAPLAVDGALNFLGTINSGTSFRFATGLLFGTACGAAVWYAVPGIVRALDMQSAVEGIPGGGSHFRSITRVVSGK